MTIYLIRHGKTEANERHLYCGSTDLSLSAAGRGELAQLRYVLPAVRFVTSGMRRTNETLQLLFGDVDFEADPRLREMDFGAFEMHSYEELKDDLAYQAWISGDNEANVTPGGESGCMMQQRVLQAFEEWRQTGQNLAIVTHGGTIAAIMAALFPQDSKTRYEWQPKPGGGYVICDGEYRILK